MNALLWTLALAALAAYATVADTDAATAADAGIAYAALILALWATLHHHARKESHDRHRHR